MSKCKKCKRELVGKQKVKHYGTYYRGKCRTCVNEECKLKQREKAKRLKLWRSYYE